MSVFVPIHQYRQGKASIAQDTSPHRPGHLSRDKLLHIRGCLRSDTLQGERLDGAPASLSG